MVAQMRAHWIFLVLFGPASQFLCIWGLLKAIIGPGPISSRYYQKRIFFQPDLPFMQFFPPICAYFCPVLSKNYWHALVSMKSTMRNNFGLTLLLTCPRNTDLNLKNELIQGYELEWHISWQENRKQEIDDQEISCRKSGTRKTGKTRKKFKFLKQITSWTSWQFL